MSDLMQNLFFYLNDEVSFKYLMRNLEYHRSSYRASELSEKLKARLNSEEKELFEKYLNVTCGEQLCYLQAMFQATLELCRELHMVL